MIYLKILFSFFKIGLFSFGGGYAAVPLIQSEIVDTNHWLKLSEFVNLITIAEMTPGPIAINSATFVGLRLAGLPGALIATFGCILPSFIILLFLSYLYIRFRNLETVQGVLAGLRPAIVSLIASAGISILVLALFNSDKSEINLSDFRLVEGGLFVISLFVLRRFKIHPILVIFGSGLIGTIIYLCSGIGA
jgi:chromate transporter